MVLRKFKYKVVEEALDAEPVYDLVKEESSSKLGILSTCSQKMSANV